MSKHKIGQGRKMRKRVKQGAIQIEKDRADGVRAGAGTGAGERIQAGGAGSNGGTAARAGQSMVVSGYTGAYSCLLYTSPSPRDRQKSRMPSSA